MITVRCKVIEQGEYSVVVSTPEMRKSKRRARRSRMFPIVPQYLCVIAKSLIYTFEVKDKIESYTTQVLYFDKSLPEELDLINDSDIIVFLQTGHVDIDVLTKMWNSGMHISYTSY